MLPYCSVLEKGLTFFKELVGLCYSASIFWLGHHFISLDFNSSTVIGPDDLPLPRKLPLSLW